MATQHIAATQMDGAGPAPSKPPLPDPPPKCDMEQFNHFSRTGIPNIIYRHFVNLGRNDVLVSGEGYICFSRQQPQTQWLAPDLVVAMGVDPHAIETNNAYEIDDVGKPPDFVLEVASRNTARRDYTIKRAGYAAFGISEYWRFDYTGGRYHDAPLNGDQLLNGRYVPIPLTTDRPGKTFGMICGYSAVLDLYLCWDEGKLRFYDPNTDEFLMTSEDLGAALTEAESARAAAERIRDSALERIRQLEAELGR